MKSHTNAVSERVCHYNQLRVVWGHTSIHGPESKNHEGGREKGGFHISAQPFTSSITAWLLSSETGVLIWEINQEPRFCQTVINTSINDKAFFFSAMLCSSSQDRKEEIKTKLLGSLFVCVCEAEKKKGGVFFMAFQLCLIVGNLIPPLLPKGLWN